MDRVAFVRQQEQMRALQVVENEARRLRKLGAVRVELRDVVALLDWMGSRIGCPQYSPPVVSPLRGDRVWGSHVAAFGRSPGNEFDQDTSESDDPGETREV